MPESNQPTPRPILGFAAGTTLLTADGMKRIEDIKPGNVIQMQPEDDQGDDQPEEEEPGWWETN